MKIKTLNRANELLENIEFCKAVMSDKFTKCYISTNYIAFENEKKDMPDSLCEDFIEFFACKQKEYKKELEDL